MRDSNVLFEWKTHPFRDDPRRALLFLLAMIAALVAVWLSFQSPGWTLLAAIILGGSLHRFWLPGHYRVSDEELEFRQGWMRVSRRFSDFRRVVFEPRGAFLSPFAEPSRLEHYRGVFLAFPAESEALKLFLQNKFSRGESRESR